MAGQGRVGGRGCTRHQGQSGHLETGRGPHSTFPASTSLLCIESISIFLCCLGACLGPLHCVHQKKWQPPIQLR